MAISIFGIEFLAEKIAKDIEPYYFGARDATKYRPLFLSDLDGDGTAEGWGWADYIKYHAVDPKLTALKQLEAAGDKEAMTKEDLAKFILNYDGGNNFALFINNAFGIRLAESDTVRVRDVFKIEDFPVEEIFDFGLFPVSIVKKTPFYQLPSMSYKFYNGLVSDYGFVAFVFEPTESSAAFHKDPELFRLYLYNSDNEKNRIGELIFKKMEINLTTDGAAIRPNATMYFKMGQYSNNLEYPYAVTPFDSIVQKDKAIMTCKGTPFVYNPTRDEYTYTVIVDGLRLKVKASSGHEDITYDYLVYYDSSAEKLAVDATSIDPTDGTAVWVSADFSSDTVVGKKFDVVVDGTIIDIRNLKTVKQGPGDVTNRCYIKSDLSYIFFTPEDYAQILIESNGVDDNVFEEISFDYTLENTESITEGSLVGSTPGSFDIIVKSVDISGYSSLYDYEETHSYTVHVATKTTGSAYGQYSLYDQSMYAHNVDGSGNEILQITPIQTWEVIGNDVKFKVLHKVKNQYSIDINIDDLIENIDKGIYIARLPSFVTSETVVNLDHSGNVDFRYDAENKYIYINDFAYESWRLDIDEGSSSTETVLINTFVTKSSEHEYKYSDSTSSSNLRPKSSEYYYEYSFDYNDGTDSSSWSIADSGSGDITSYFSRIDDNEKRIYISSSNLEDIDTGDYPLTLKFTQDGTQINEFIENITDCNIPVYKLNTNLENGSVLTEATDALSEDVSDIFVTLDQDGSTEVIVYNENETSGELNRWNEITFDVNVSYDYIGSGTAATVTHYMETDVADVTLDELIYPAMIAGGDRFKIEEFYIELSPDTSEPSYKLFSFGDTGSDVTIDLVGVNNNPTSFSGALYPPELNEGKMQKSVYTASVIEPVIYYLEQNGISFIREGNNVKLDESKYPIVDGYMELNADGKTYNLSVDRRGDTVYSYLIEYFMKKAYDKIMEFIYNLTVNKYADLEAYILELDFRHQYDDPLNGTYFFIDRAGLSASRGIPQQRTTERSLNSDIGEPITPESMSSIEPIYRDAQGSGVYMMAFAAIWNVRDGNDNSINRVVVRKTHSTSGGPKTDLRVSSPKDATGNYCPECINAFVTMDYTPNPEEGTENTNEYVVLNANTKGFTVTDNGEGSSPRFTVNTTAKYPYNNNLAVYLIELLDSSGNTITEVPEGEDYYGVFRININPDDNDYIAFKNWREGGTGIVINSETRRWTKFTYLNRRSGDATESDNVPSTGSLTGQLVENSKAKDGWTYSDYIQILSEKAKIDSIEVVGGSIILRCIYVNMFTNQPEKPTPPIELYGIAINPDAVNPEITSEFVDITGLSVGGYIWITKVKDTKQYLVVKHRDYAKEASTTLELVQETLLKSTATDADGNSIFIYDDTISDEANDQYASLMKRLKSLNS